MKICLRQWQTPPQTTKIEVEGAGDCCKCTPHQDNKHCILFYEITAPQGFEVKND